MFRRSRFFKLFNGMFQIVWSWLKKINFVVRSPKRWGLFGTTIVWVALTICVFTILGWMWGSGSYLSRYRIFANWIGDELQTEPFERVKVSLTAIGGIGAVGYLVIKYRERAGVEHNAVDEKLVSAVQQLGSDSPQVRIAGVYSLEDLADVYGGSYRQRVVDILCGYLRVERGRWYSPDGAEVRTREIKDSSGLCYVTDDGPVESTILSVLARHLRKERIDSSSRHQVKQDVSDDQLWCNCEIDLHGAHFTERVRLDGVTCRHFNASDAYFHDIFSMKMSTFTGGASFYGAVFSETTWFSGSKFRVFVNFNKATFKNCVTFSRSSFEGEACFREIRYEESGYGVFSGALFNVEYWHADPPIYLVMSSGNSAPEIPPGAGWADFSGGSLLKIDEPKVWCRKNGSRISG